MKNLKIHHLALVLLTVFLATKSEAVGKNQNRIFAPTPAPAPISGTVGYIETEGYYPAVIFEGKASESIYNGLSVSPYQANDGTWVKSGPNIVCAKATKMEGLDEVTFYQCFATVHPKGTTHPGYIRKTPNNEPPPPPDDDERCRGRWKN
jgi:hypothetical protein